MVTTLPEMVGFVGKIPEERTTVKRKGTGEHGKAEKTELVRKGTAGAAPKSAPKCVSFFF